MNRRTLHLMMATFLVIAAIVFLATGGIVPGIVLAVAAVLSIANYVMNWRNAFDHRPAAR